MNLSSYISNFQAIIIVISLSIYIILLLFKSKQIIKLVKNIPIWLVGVNFSIFFYKVFFIPHIFSTRSDIGVSLLGIAKNYTFFENLHDRVALYNLLIKSFSQIFNGISINFIANFHITLAFINCFAIFILINFLFKNKNIASFSSFFYIISPVTFIISLTEDYTNIAMFFSIQAICFFSIYIYNKNLTFFSLAIVSSMLAVYARPEYVLFGFLFLLLLHLYRNSFRKNKYYLILISYFLFILQRTVQSILLFMSLIGNESVNGTQVKSSDSILIALTKHLNIFVDNFKLNIDALLSFKILISTFIIIFLISFFSDNFKKFKKLILFFLLYLIIFLVNYSYLHIEGFYSGFKYIATLIFPLSVLAGIGYNVLYSEYNVASRIFLVIILGFSMVIVSPAMKSKVQLPNYFNNRMTNDIMTINKEYEMFMDSKNEINYNGLFINNGAVSLLDSVLPINEKNIISISLDPELFNSYKNIIKERDDDSVYISQGSRAFAFTDDSNDIFIKSCFIDHKPEEFEDMINEYFNIDKTFFSFYTEDKKHIFFYKVSLKN